MKQKYLSAYKGFTIVELAVTLLIVGVLAAVAIPVYNNYTRKAALAEAYTGVDTMAKNEVTYFMTHKSFISTTPNPGFFQYSQSKMKQFPGSTWDTLGYPYNPNTPIQFNYTAYAGKNDTSGNEVTTAIASDGSGFWPTNVSLYSMRNVQPYGPGCTSYAANNYDHLDEYVQTTSKSQYNWVAIQASRDMNPSTDQCTYIIKIVDTNTQGKIQQSAAIFRDKGD